MRRRLATCALLAALLAGRASVVAATPAAAGPAPVVGERVAVLELELAPGLALDRVYFSDRIRGLLGEAGPAWHLMTRENIEVLLATNQRDLADCQTDCVVETARRLGADFVVSGRAARPGSDLVLSLRLHSTAGARLLGAVEVSGANVDALRAALPGAVTRLAEALREASAARVAQEPAQAGPPASAPPAAEARAASAPARGRDSSRFTEPKSGLAFVRLPGGTFLSGCEPRDPRCTPEERPARRVTLAPFALGRTEATASAYARCVAARACTEPNTGEECNWKAGREEHPINCLDQPQAAAFCKWLGGRLPTADEWESAAKAQEGRLFPWGDQEPTQDRAIWAASGTAPVGARAAGAGFGGLLDLAGNVWEWTSTGSGRVRQLRGGAWNTLSPEWLRGSARRTPEQTDRSAAVGVRCAFDIAR